MTTPLMVTAAAASVTLVDRAGTATFSVTNNLPGPVRARATVWTETPAPWIALDGEPVRTVPPGGAEAYQVSFRPGPEVPPGTYRYRLDVLDLDHPDDRGAQSPVGTVTVPEPTILPRPARRIPWWILVLALVLLVVLGALAYAFTRDPEVVRPSEPPAEVVLLKFEDLVLQMDIQVFPIDLNRPDELELDSGQVTTAGGDVRFANGLLRAVNGGRLQARGDGKFPMGKAACEDGFSDSAAGTPVAGARFCLRTGDGRVAEIMVTGAKFDEIAISGVVYEVTKP